MSINRKRVRRRILKWVPSDSQQWWLDVMGRAYQGNTRAVARLRRVGLAGNKPLKWTKPNNPSSQPGGGGGKDKSKDEPDLQRIASFTPPAIKKIPGPPKVGANTYRDPITGLNVTTVAPPDFGGNPYFTPAKPGVGKGKGGKGGGKPQTPKLNRRIKRLRKRISNMPASPERQRLQERLGRLRRARKRKLNG